MTGTLSFDYSSTERGCYDTFPNYQNQRGKARTDEEEWQHCGKKPPRSALEREGGVSTTTWSKAPDNTTVKGEPL